MSRSTGKDFLGEFKRQGPLRAESKTLPGTCHWRPGRYLTDITKVFFSQFRSGKAVQLTFALGSGRSILFAFTLASLFGTAFAQDCNPLPTVCAELLECLGLSDSATEQDIIDACNAISNSTTVVGNCIQNTEDCMSNDTSCTGSWIHCHQLEFILIMVFSVMACCCVIGGNRGWKWGSKEVGELVQRVKTEMRTERKEERAPLNAQQGQHAPLNDQHGRQDPQVVALDF